MQWITLATPPLQSVEQFDAVLAGQSAEPDGLEARYVGTTENDNLCIVTVWESKAHADNFFAHTLGPALAKALGPEPVGKPEVVGLAVARAYTRESVMGGRK
jgi:heme-degrading monooxygenase HmoA